MLAPMAGTGFIGRHLMTFLVESNECSKIRIVDKVLPETAYLTERQHAALNNPVCEFKQGNLTNEGAQPSTR
jgi:nucleoside-diphosphate-sugar epimerase